MDAEQTLRSVPLFEKLEPKHVRTLAKWTHTRTYQPDQVIVQQGQRGLGLYCIQTGKVKITQETPSGPREIRTMDPGHSFGELALLDDEPRSATVTALEQTTCVLLDKAQFLAELRTHPEISLAILPIIVGWLREAHQEIATLS